MKYPQFWHIRKDRSGKLTLSGAGRNNGGVCLYAEPSMEHEAVILWGMAKCHDRDSYQRKIGRDIARGRVKANHVVTPMYPYPVVRAAVLEIAGLNYEDFLAGQAVRDILDGYRKIIEG